MGAVVARDARGWTAKNLDHRMQAPRKTGYFARKIAPSCSGVDNFDRPVFWPVGQFFTGHRRRLRPFSALALLRLLGLARGGWLLCTIAAAGCTGATTS